MIDKIKEKIEVAAIKSGIEKPIVYIEHPDDISHGDFSTNIALIYAKEKKENPKSLAEKICKELNKDLPDDIESINTAGPGFINFKIKDKYFFDQIELIKENKNFGKNEKAKREKVMVEYTDPNPFKVFHIGHFMSNAIGESISRLIEFSGRDVKRANWQGDVGPHVAKAIFGAKILLKEGSKFAGIEFWGEAYKIGASRYEEDISAKKEIDEINKKIYERNDIEINNLYDKGRKESLESFERIYKKLGTKFDHYFFEGIEGRKGELVVKDFLKKGIFEESEGAIIFPGEKYGLHTRVFITSKGLPTYETKEIGLNKEKFKIYPDLARSIIITANEQSDYFNVLLKVFSFIDKNISEKTKHISHGMMRFASGKMSSRTGNVISLEDMMSRTEDLVASKMKDRNFEKEEMNEIKSNVALAAMKYAVLRQAIGGDIIYDEEKSLSFEGDSGPYLQYACVRANTVLTKAKEIGIKNEIKETPDKISNLEKMLVRFPEIVNKANVEYAPHHVVTYLTLLASLFNSYYAENQIIDIKNPLSPYRVATTAAFTNVMKNGLWLLGIKVPERM